MSNAIENFIRGLGSAAEPEDQDDIDRLQEAFLRDFRALVRHYVPEYPMKLHLEEQTFEVTSFHRMALLYRIQENCSVFQPYVWSENYDR